ncbi:hypothetical protein B0T10DRAFT_483876 [Thelonectria olida]|uniref:F-box domain-containing protein n=1 Tax=Thelonectria olida TaxID=1576542 RepID=A0A9P8W6V5_9HYPO|nr:hypothetical protein B0T10DRAFT_483876 [Thelonectria olida]
MAGLLDLPNELLRSIVEYVSDTEHIAVFQLALVNKRLKSIVSPSMLVRHWPAQQHPEKRPSVQRLVLHLLRHSELRTHVKWICFAHEDTLERYFPEDIDIKSEELEALYKQQRENWPTLTEPVDHQGEQMPIDFATLVLFWATDIIDLEIQIPHFNPDPNYEHTLDAGLDPVESPEAGSHFLPLVLASHTAKTLKSMNPAQLSAGLPLAELRHVTTTWRPQSEGNWAAPFFYLPKVKTFFGRGVRLYVNGVEEEVINAQTPSLEHLAEFPVGTSSIEAIILDQADIPPEGLGLLARACRRLKRLIVTDDCMTNLYDVNLNYLAQVILHHKESLEDFTFHWDWYDDVELVEDFDDGPIALGDCFQELVKLKSLNINLGFYRTSSGGYKHLFISRLPPLLENLTGDLRLIFEEGPNDQKTLDVCKLPSSLKSLTLHGLGSWANFPEYRERVAHYMSGFHAIMRSCGPEGKFPELRTVSLPVVEHDTIEGIELLKELAEKNGVGLELQHLKEW